MYDHADGDASAFMQPDDYLISIRAGRDGGHDCVAHSFAAVSYVSLDWCDDGPPGEEYDCNENNVPDICDICYGTSADCNGNWIPDECDIEEGTSEDCQCPPNGVPDECEIGFGEVTLSEPAVYDVGSLPTGVNATAQTADDQTVPLDVNSDGYGDLVVVNSGGLNKKLTVLWNNGSGGFSAPTDVALTSGIIPYRAAAGDFDADGDYDLAVTSIGGSGKVRILLNNGLNPSPPYDWQGFTEAAEVPVGDYPRSIVTADLDSDGDLDLATANKGDGNISVLYYDHELETFAPVTNSPLAVGESYEQAYGIVAGDLDGNGLLDLAAANADDNVVGVCLNAGGQNASLTFAAADFYSVGGNGREPESLALADFDHDGDLDIVSANKQTQTVGVLRNLGGNPWAGFGGVQEDDVPYGLDKTKCEMEPLFVFTADLDCDGLPEICTTDFVDFGAQTLTHFVNNFTQQVGLDFAIPEHTDLAATGELVHAAGGDFNADGMVDLAIVCKQTSGEVWVLLNLSEPPSSRDYNPPNGTPDECECPEVATVSAVSPPDGAIDARKPHPNDATTPLYGFGMPDDPGTLTKDESTFYPIIIDIGVEGADYLGCWAICETDGGAPLEEGANSIVSCTEIGQGQYELILDHGAKTGYVTTIEYLGDITGASYVEYIHLPADADGSGDSNGNDIIAVVDCLNHQN